MLDLGLSKASTGEIGAQGFLFESLLETTSPSHAVKIREEEENKENLVKCIEWVYVSSLMNEID